MNRYTNKAQQALAVAILEGNINAGDHVIVDSDGEELIFVTVIPQMTYA